jgi:hypothetical protein
MANRKDKEKRQGVNVAIVVAIIGAIASISTGYFSYFAGLREKQVEIEATQTAEARKPTIQTVIVTVPFIVTHPVTVTPEPTLTLDPLLIDSMDVLSNWTPSFCDNKCGGPNGSSALSISLVPGSRNNAVEVIYDLKKAGWVLITKNIDPNLDLKILSKTVGVSFMYKSSSSPNKIELKFLLRYPGDTEDTAFGASWKTSPSDDWTRLEARYDKDISCWWPEALCQKHGNRLEFSAIRRIDLAIANIGEITSLGKMAFDDLVGIPP